MSADYTVGELIFDGARSLVYRARRSSDGLSVIVKRLRVRHPSPQQLAAFAREFDITSAAAGEGVIGVHEFRAEEGLVLEDFGARSLAMILRERRLTLEEALLVAVQIADALARVHRLDIVHRDVNPSNIVLNEATDVARLIDFGIAQVLSRESPQTFEGTPRYASPEQTGRMNRPVDHRSDLYSLGITLYELLTGATPFDARDPLELIHAHIARSPPAVREVDPNIPEPVSRIVATLLQKAAEQRYLGAQGLRHDLATCLEAVRASPVVRSFPLRSKDIDERLRVPQALYGREREVARLYEASVAAATGRARLLFVAGYSGIGKTSLVRELRRLLAGGRARTVEGKYDQYRRAEPYSGLREALRDLVRQLLTEPDEVIASVRARILESVGSIGRVVVELVEDLERVIGPQPDVETLPPSEARNRLQVATASLVRGLATADRPLVLFLDDLQWADLPSFELLERIVGDPNLRHTLVVGAYRDNEVDDDHALRAMARALEGSAEVATINLGPLREEDVAGIVSDAVFAAPGHVRLASIVYDRTRGNAFYLNRFLESLYEDGLLRFDPALEHWTWDHDVIAARPVTENVVEFLSERIRRLPDVERACLLHASVIGDRFDLDTLAAARGATRSDTLSALAGAIRAELVQPEGDGFWYVKVVDEAHTNFAWRFAHDRIRQAAHALLDPADAELLHLRVGRHLLRRLGEEDRAQRVFELVDHLHTARRLLDREELLRLEGLQGVAGRRALASAAFDTAHKIFSGAVDALDSHAWAERYELVLALHLDAARAAWLSGDLDAMDRLVRVTLIEARSLLDRVAAREVEIDALVGQQRFGEAVQVALQALAQLGVTFPDDPGDGDVGAAVMGALEALRAVSADEIVAMREVDDPVVAVAMRIQVAIMSSSYLARPKLFALLPCSLVRTTLRHGVTRQSPYSFAVFAIVLNVINQIDVGYATGEVARRLLDRWDDRAGRARTEHVIYNQVNTFVDPLRPTLDAQLRVFHLGMDTGDLEYAAWALQCIGCNGFYAGLDLADLSARTDRHIALMRHHRQIPALVCSTPWQQLLRNLTQPTADPRILTGPDFDEAKEVARHRAANFRGALCVLTVTGTFARFLFRDLESAVAWADAGAEFLDGAGSTYHVIAWHQLHALAHLGLDRDPADLAASRAQLALWLRFSPVNHQHRVDLVEAEVARVEGRAGDAMTLYDRSIEHAHANRFVHEEALANELAGRFYFARGHRTPARAYLIEAAWLWRRWGATVKAAHLEAEFAELLREATAEAATSTRDTTVSTTDSTTSETATLDLDTLFKAASAISGEIHIDRLVSRILEVAMENAGATRGALLFERDGTLRVEASLAVAEGGRIALGTAAADCPAPMTNVVSYVARARESALVSDVRGDPRWQGTVAFTADRPTSILCLPVSHQGGAIGVLYLENDLVGGAFTPERGRILELLAAQAAISIENARLYHNLERSLETQVRLTNAHRRFVPHPFLESLARTDISEVTLGDSVRKEMSILFADMRDFTRHVAGMTGEESIRFINRYLAFMEPPIHRHGGFVDSYIGDAIMALFDDPDGAIQAAIGMQRALEALNAERATPLAFGLGVNTGDLTLGTIGTENRVKCGVIGDCVNIASRVESLTRKYGVPLLTTEWTRARLRHPFALRFVDRVVVKGHSRPVGLYEVFDADPTPLRDAKLAVADLYESAVAAYRARDFEDARSRLELCRAALPDDRVVALFIERCVHYTNEPPTGSWDGAEVLGHK